MARDTHSRLPRAALVALLAAQRQQRKRAVKSLRPSPSTPAAPPPTSPRSPALDRGRSLSDRGAPPASLRPGMQGAAAGQSDAMAGKTNVIPYSQYRKSRLDSIRSDLGLTGACAPGQAVSPARSKPGPKGRGRCSPK